MPFLKSEFKHSQEAGFSSPARQGPLSAPELEARAPRLRPDLEIKLIKLELHGYELRLQWEISSPPASWGRTHKGYFGEQRGGR